MSLDEISVRQWQEQFRTGAFEDKSFETQCKAGWYDWFCGDDALSGRLKKIAKVVMGITEPYLLDNYYVWFKNNCPMAGPLYDDVRFEPLSGERDGKYFLVSLNSPRVEKKWALITERDGFGMPEFECADVRDMVKYINGMVRELEQGIRPVFLAEKAAAEQYFMNHGCQYAEGRTHRDGDGRYHHKDPYSGQVQTVLVVSHAEDIPPDLPAEQAEKIDGLYVCSLDASQSAPSPARQAEGRRPHKKQQER